jgi:plastocyanin
MRIFHQLRNLEAVLVVISAAVIPLATSGCGDVENSGASRQTTVTIKPSDSADDSPDNGGNGDGPTASGFGTLRGRVVFQGTAPTLPAIYKKGAPIADRNVCAAVDLPDERLVVGPGGGVQNVFVYLPKAPRGAPKTEAPQDPVLFDQKGCRFIPRALFVRVGQPVQVVSGDPIAHNTHLKPKRNADWNRGIKAGDRVGVTFNYAKAEPAPAPVICDIHAWMRAYHLPLDHPFAAVTQEDGSFEISNIPAGTHNFRVWHEGVAGGVLQRNLKVIIKPGEVEEVEVTYPAEKFSAG